MSAYQHISSHHDVRLPGIGGGLPDAWAIVFHLVPKDLPRYYQNMLAKDFDFPLTDDTTNTLSVLHNHTPRWPAIGDADVERVRDFAHETYEPMDFADAGPSSSAAAGSSSSAAAGPSSSAAAGPSSSDVQGAAKKQKNRRGELMIC